MDERIGQGGGDFLDAEEIAQVVERGQVAGIAEDHGEDIVLEGERQDLVDAGHGLGHQGQRLGRGLELLGSEQLEAELIGERLLQLHFGDEAARQGGLAEQGRRCSWLLRGRPRADLHRGSPDR